MCARIDKGRAGSAGETGPECRQAARSAGKHDVLQTVELGISRTDVVKVVGVGRRNEKDVRLA